MEENPYPIYHGEGFLEVFVRVFLEAIVEEVGGVLSNVAHL